MKQDNESFSYTYSAERQEEVRRICQKYAPPGEDSMEQLRKLDESATRPGKIVALTAGLFGALLLGIGMCCTMVWTGVFVPGILIGVGGIVSIGASLPLSAAITKRQRAKLAPQIMSLRRALLREG